MRPGTIRIALTAVFAALSFAAASARAAEPTPYNPNAMTQHIQAPGNVWRLAVANVAGDATPEIVMACYDGTIACQDKASGRVLWTFETGVFTYDLNAEDLDGDGRAETLAASANGTVYCLGPDGALKWSMKSPGAMYQVTVAHVVDQPWVLASGADINLYVLDADGKVLKTMKAKRFPVRLIGAGDLDGDEKDEVVVSNFMGELVAYKGPELTEIWKERIRPFNKRKTETKSGTFRPYTIHLDDLDGDGKSEILLGAGFYNNEELRVLDGKGQTLWGEADGFTDRVCNYAYTEVRSADLAPTPGKEVIGLSARTLILFDAKGNRLGYSRGKELAFCDIDILNPGEGGAEIVLGSGPNGGDQMRVVRLDEGWTEACADMKRAGKMARIEANIAKVREQIAAYDGKAPEGRGVYYNRLTGGSPNTPRLIEGHFPRVKYLYGKYPYANLGFYMNIYMLTEEGVPGFKFRPGGGKIHKQAEVVDNVKLCEAAGIPFAVGVDHSCIPSVPLELCEEICKACPKTLVGFYFAEDEQTDERLDHFIDDYWVPLMDICKKYDKKLVMIEKNTFWATNPAMERCRKAFDPKYADVMVMSVEDSNSRSPEVNLAGRFGLRMSGLVNNISARTIQDELCWSRYWEWEFPMTGHPFLRRQMVQTLLGATHFEYTTDIWAPHGGQSHVDDTDPGLSLMGREHVDPMLHMLGKGLLIPPHPDEVLTAAPVAIRMREPSGMFLEEGHNGHGHHLFHSTPLERESPFEGMSCYWGMAPVADWYWGEYLMGQDRHYGEFAPATPYGMPTIVPAFRGEDHLSWAKRTIETDGSFFYVDGKKLNGPEAKPVVEAMYAEAAETLPFRALGDDVFMQAQSLGPDRARVTLVDSGFLDPADRDVRLLVNTRKPVKELVDLLSGEKLEIRDGEVSLTVPAGVFRILEARF